MYLLKVIGVVGGVGVGRGVDVLRHRRDCPLMHGLEMRQKAVSSAALMSTVLWS
jgi:hypothetical protein